MCFLNVAVVENGEQKKQARREANSSVIGQRVIGKKENNMWKRN